MGMALPLARVPGCSHLFAQGSYVAAGSLVTSPNLTEDAAIMTIPPPNARLKSCAISTSKSGRPTTIARQLNINRGTVKRVSADDWDAADCFSSGQGFRVIAHDRRGHGPIEPSRHGE